MTLKPIAVIYDISTLLLLQYLQNSVAKWKCCTFLLDREIFQTKYPGKANRLNLQPLQLEYMCSWIVTYRQNEFFFAGYIYIYIFKLHNTTKKKLVFPSKINVEVTQYVCWGRGSEIRYLSFSLWKWILIDKYNVKSTKHCSRKPLRQQKMQGGVLIILFSSKTEMKPNKEGWAKKENRK